MIEKDAVTIDLANQLRCIDKDIMDWYRLPFNLRMRANDECIKQFGCSKTDYYNREKERILSAMEKEKEEEAGNNLTKVSESLVLEFSENPNYLVDKLVYDNYPDLLKKSRDIQMSSPFIVLIDPDIGTIEELNSRYNSFCLLSKRNKRLSNSISVKIWRYNVYNMYNIIKNYIETPRDNASNIDPINRPILDKDENNIVRLNSQTDLTERAIKDSYDYINNSLLEGNPIPYECLKYDASTNGNNYNTVVMKKLLESIEEVPNDFNLDIVLNNESFKMENFPFFTPYELDKLYDDNKEYFYEPSNKPLYEQIEEGKDNILSLGWIPNLPHNKHSMAFARGKILNYVNELKVLDLTTMSECIEIKENYDSLHNVLYFVFTYDSDYKRDFCKSDFKSVYVTNENNCNSFYRINIDPKNKYDNITFTFTKSLDENIVEIYALPVGINAYNKINENVFDSKDSLIPERKSIFTSLLNDVTNKFDPLVMNMVLCNYMDIMSKTAKNVKVNHENRSIYRVYSGDANYNMFNKIRSLYHCISNKYILKEYTNEYEDYTHIVDTIFNKYFNTQSLIYNI